MDTFFFTNSYGPYPNCPNLFHTKNLLKMKNNDLDMKKYPVIPLNYQDLIHVVNFKFKVIYKVSPVII